MAIKLSARTRFAIEELHTDYPASSGLVGLGLQRTEGLGSTKGAAEWD